MDIWQAGSTAETLTEGWLGKALKGMPGAPSFHLKAANQRAPLALDGAPVRGPSIASLAEFQLQMAAASGADKAEQRKVIEGAVTASKGKPGLLDFVSRTAANTPTPAAGASRRSARTTRRRCPTPTARWRTG
jgi:hypothetical protein